MCFNPFQVVFYYLGVCAYKQAYLIYAHLITHDNTAHGLAFIIAHSLSNAFIYFSHAFCSFFFSLLIIFNLICSTLADPDALVELIKKVLAVLSKKP